MNQATRTHRQGHASSKKGPARPAWWEYRRTQAARHALRAGCIGPGALALLAELHALAAAFGTRRVWRSRADLAAALGCCPASVTTWARQLADAGLIRVEVRAARHDRDTGQFYRYPTTYWLADPPPGDTFGQVPPSAKPSRSHLSKMKKRGGYPAAAPARPLLDAVAKVIDPRRIDESGVDHPPICGCGHCWPVTAAPA